MKTSLLPLLCFTAFAGLMALPISLGLAIMVLLTAGVGAIMLQDYSSRPRLALRGRRVFQARANFPALMARAESNRLAA